MNVRLLVIIAGFALASFSILRVIITLIQFSNQICKDFHSRMDKTERKIDKIDSKLDIVLKSSSFNKKIEEKEKVTV